MEPFDDIEKAEQHALDEFKHLTEELSTRTGVPDDWFRNMLYGVLKCALHDYELIQTGVKDSMYKAAWGVRNLTELRVITAYILASADNAAEFRSQLIFDSWQFFEALSRLTLISHEKVALGLAELAAQGGENQPIFEYLYEKQKAEPPQNEAPQAEADKFKQALKDLGLDAFAFKRTKQMAASQGDLMADELYALNVICSKLLHRTSLSIASATSEDSLTEIGSSFRSTGLTDLLVIFDAIEKHVRQHGLHPNPANTR